MSPWMESVSSCVLMEGSALSPSPPTPLFGMGPSGATTDFDGAVAASGRLPLSGPVFFGRACPCPRSSRFCLNTEGAAGKKSAKPAPGRDIVETPQCLAL